MKTLVFATNNPNKVAEVRNQLGTEFEIKTLVEIGCDVDIPETADTLEGNAFLKANYVRKHYNLDCFADDTGLEVSALGGEPGVLSARYAGASKDPEANMDKVLAGLAEKTDRSARFRTSICLLLDGERHQFDGVATGTIIPDRTGDQGFGYDPIFKPDGHDRTFAQMTTSEKNVLSHRGKAVAALVAFLREQG